MSDNNSAVSAMTSRIYQSDEGNKQEENNLKMLLSWHLKQLNEEDIKEKQKKRRDVERIFHITGQRHAFNIG